MSISQSVILRHSDFEFEQVIAFEFSLLSYFQYNLRSISAIFSYFTWCQKWDSNSRLHLELLRYILHGWPDRLSKFVVFGHIATS